MPLLRFPRASVLVYLFLLAATTLRAAEPVHYSDLARLFTEWRAFEQPVLHDGVPTTLPLPSPPRHVNFPNGRLASTPSTPPAGPPHSATTGVSSRPR